MINGIKKIAPVRKGIANSLVWKNIMRNLPTDFTNPDAIIKLILKTAPNNSVNSRPSRYENTNPHIQTN